MKHTLQALLVVLTSLGSYPTRADFVAYNLFGSSDPAAVGPKITTWGLASGLVLGESIYFENFDAATESQIGSTGWWQVNYTDPVSGHTVDNPNDAVSNTYLGWVPITRTRLESVFGARRLQVAPGQVVNGQAVTQLLSGKLLYAESDLRSGNQVQYLYSPIYNLVGQRGIVLAFNSAYEQNQDNIAGLEFTIDGGNTWRPLLYMIDRDDLIRRTDGTIDAVTTLTTRYSDVASYVDPTSGQVVGGFYGAFLGAPITSDLAPYLSGRINDDQAN